MNPDHNGPFTKSAQAGTLARLKRKDDTRKAKEKAAKVDKVAAQKQDRERRFRVYLRDNRCCRAMGIPLLFDADNKLRLANNHHIVHRSQGGTDEDSNTITLSYGMHQKHHDGLLGIHGDANGTVEFREYRYEGGTRKLLRVWEG